MASEIGFFLFGPRLRGAEVPGFLAAGALFAGVVFFVTPVGSFADFLGALGLLGVLDLV